MKMTKTVWITLLASSLLTACSGTKSTVVAEMTPMDKQLTCQEMQMDITEAQFLKAKAEKNRGFSFKHIIMPLSYPSTYMSADEASEAADNRVLYLTKLYQAKGCDAQPQQHASAAWGQVTPSSYPAAQPSYPAQRVAAQPVYAPATPNVSEGMGGPEYAHVVPPTYSGASYGF